MNFKTQEASECTPQAREMLLDVERQVGFLPNVFGMLSESSAVLAAVIEMNNLFAHTTLNQEQREIVQLVASVENNATYCVAGHTTFYSSIRDDLSLAEHIRERQILRSDSEDYDTNVILAEFTRQLIVAKGNVTKAQFDNFHEAGFDSKQVFEVILGIAIKTITNLSSNVASTSLDTQFEAYSWNKG